MEHCKELKLTAVIHDCPAFCRQACDGGWACEELLREACFADVKTLEQVE
jgi:hypothetical protein